MHRSFRVARLETASLLSDLHLTRSGREFMRVVLGCTWGFASVWESWADRLGAGGKLSIGKPVPYVSPEPSGWYSAASVHHLLAPEKRNVFF